MPEKDMAGQLEKKQNWTTGKEGREILDGRGARREKGKK